MNRIGWLLLLGILVSAPLPGCVLGDCAAVCSDPFTLTFVDESGNAVNGAYGTLGWAGALPRSFDCSQQKGHFDGGAAISCAGNTLTEPSYADHRAVTLSVATDSGKAFSGPVSLGYSPSGTNVCGSTCEAAAADVVLK